MQWSASGGSAASAGDRRRPNRGRGRPSFQQAQPCSLEGASLRSFLASRPRAAATWAGGLLALWAFLTILTLAGNIESNSGPQTKYTCPSCNKNITHSQGSIRCNRTPTHWTLIKCSGINIRQYTDTWKCKIDKTPSNTTQTKHQTAQNMNQSLNALQSQSPHTSAPDKHHNEKQPTYNTEQ